MYLASRTACLIYTVCPGAGRPKHTPPPPIHLAVSCFKTGSFQPGELSPPDEQALFLMQRMISPTWTKDLLLKNLAFAETLAPLTKIFRLNCTKNPEAAAVMKLPLISPYKTLSFKTHPSFSVLPLRSAQHTSVPGFHTPSCTPTIPLGGVWSRYRCAVHLSA